MTKINCLINILFPLLVITFSVISQCSSSLSDKRLCYDPECSEPVSLARTILKYSPKEKELLGFGVNVNVKVYSKEAGSRPDLWGVEINGKRGYAPKTFIREHKILHKNLKHEVPVNLLPSNKGKDDSNDKKLLPKKQNDVYKVVKNAEPFNGQIGISNLKSTQEEVPHTLTGITPPFEVIDGTTIKLNHDEPSIQPNIVPNVQATAVLNEQNVIDTGSHVTSNLQKTESSILAKADEIQQKIIDTSNEHKDDDVSHPISIKNVLASSEDIPDLPQNTETEVPSFGMNVSSKGDLIEESDVIKESIDNAKKSDKDDGQSSKKTVDVSSTKSMPDLLEGITAPDTKDVKPLMHDSVKETPVTDTKGTETLVSDPVKAEVPTVYEHVAPASDNVQEIILADAKESEPSISAPITKSPLPDIKDTVSSIANSINADASTHSKHAEPLSDHVVDIIVTGTKDPKPLVTNSVKQSTLTDTKDTKSSIADPVKPEIINVSKNTESVFDRVKESTVTDTTDIKPPVPDPIEAATITNGKDMKSSESDNIKTTLASDAKDPIFDANVGSLLSLEPRKQAADVNGIGTVEDNSQKTDNKHIESASKSELKDAHSLDKSGSHLQVEQTNNGGYISSLLQELGFTDTDQGIIPDANVVVEEQIVPETQTYEPEETTVSPTDLENATFHDPHASDSLAFNEVNVAPDAPYGTTLSLEPKVDNLNFTENNNISNVLKEEITDENVERNIQDYTATEIIRSGNEVGTKNVGFESNTIVETAKTNETDVNIIVNSKENLVYDSNSTEVPIELIEFSQHINEKSDLNAPEQVLHSSQESMISDHTSNMREYLVVNQQGSNIQQSKQSEIDDIIHDKEGHAINEILPEYGGDINVDKVLRDTSNDEDIRDEASTLNSILHEVQVSQPDVCNTDDECANDESAQQHHYMDDGENSQNEESVIISGTKVDHNYWLTLIYLSVTAATTLIFSLGYYYIENLRRDWQLIAKINKLEKDLLVSTKECTMLNENLKATKDKLTCIEDESFGSNEMVLSLKADLESSQIIKVELEDQVAMLEKDLETATEAGLELERMLREVLSSNNEVNPLAQSVEDLQARLNAQQAANESLTNALNLMTQEKEALSADLTSLTKKYEELKVELTRVSDSLKMEVDSKNTMEHTLSDKVHRAEMKIKEISTEKSALQKELKAKEAETKDLVDVINQLNSNNLDLDKLYDVSRIKSDATALLEERNELKIRLTEVEGAHNLLEEHMKVVKEEIVTLNEQCKVAEKDKKDAETRLEVLSNFFKEKEAQRQKEEAVWLQKQGEVVSTVERIHTMQNEIQNYKQQVEILKHEILDQEREYKSQISLLEMKAHEQWVVARQVERRLEESKAEAGQLRNRLTLIEKNINDVDPEQKLHRLEANGETTTSHPLFIGAESSSSPIMFTGSSGVPPPPPPSYLHSLFPPYLPPPPLPSTSGVPPYEVGQRPPPLGGRLSSPPPMPLHPPAGSRYDNAGSPPPPMSPHMFPSFNHHRSPPPPFGSDRIHPPPPPHGPILHPPHGTTHSWGEESLPLPRNSGFHPHQRERIRNHKGSLHSSGESLDKTHHSSKV